MDKPQIRLVIEILGRPADHVKSAMHSLVEKLGKENGVKILEKSINEPVLVKDSKDLFTTFAEVLVEVDTIFNYLGIIFAYMPSHVEIISPEKITLSNVDLTDLGNRLMQRLHEYDAITKNVVMERDILVKKLQEVAPHLFKPKTSMKETSTTELKEKRNKPSKAKKSKK